MRDRDDAEKRRTKNKSWDHGDKGQGRDGLSKGYGGSEGEGAIRRAPDGSAARAVARRHARGLYRLGAEIFHGIFGHRLDIRSDRALTVIAKSCLKSGPTERAFPVPMREYSGRVW